MKLHSTGMSGSVKVVRTEEDGREIFLYYHTPSESCISSILSGLAQDTSKVKRRVSRILNRWKRIAK